MFYIRLMGKVYPAAVLRRMPMVSSPPFTVSFVPRRAWAPGERPPGLRASGTPRHVPGGVEHERQSIFRMQPRAAGWDRWHCAMRENRMRERFCRHAAQGQVCETLTRDLFSRLTFVSFHVHVAGCLPCGLLRLFFTREEVD